MDLAYWVCVIVTLLSAAVSLGYSIHAAGAASGEGLVPARYALSRSVALLVVAAIAPFTGLVSFVAAAAIAMVLVQTLDAIVGITIRDVLKSIGPAAMATVNLVALIWMLAV